MNTPVPPEVAESIVGAAVQAPSSHNTQPWLFKLLGDTVELHADRTRALPVNDPFDRELSISCGAALFNLVVAASHHGFEAAVALRPDRADHDLLARVVLSPGAATADGLAAAIPMRRTTRDSFDDATVTADIGAQLTEIVAGHGATLQLLDGAPRSALATLVAEGDRIQFADPRWRRELASWMHPRRKGDGLVVPELLGLATRAVVSVVDLGKTTAGKDHELIEDAPVVAVLATDDDDADAWLAAGEALEHALLVAAQHGMHAGYLNQPCQVETLRGRLQDLLEDGRHPQVVLRLGPLAEPPRPTPRRPVADVIITD